MNNLASKFALVTGTSSGIGEEAWRAATGQHVNHAGALQPAGIAEAIMFSARLPRRAKACQMLIRPTGDTAPM